MWEAIEHPSNMPVPDNVIGVSAEGYGNSRMAGGDYDGDLIQCSFDTELIELVLGTAEAVGRPTLLRWNNRSLFSWTKKRLTSKQSDASAVKNTSASW